MSRTVELALAVDGLSCTHGRSDRDAVRAVDSISFAIPTGRTLGLVGESGCGKSSTARAVMGLVPRVTGSVKVCGTEVVGASRADRRRARGLMQMVFQEPFSSMNPRWRVERIIAEPAVALSRRERVDAERLDDLMRRCGLDPSQRRRYPHQFSGGQHQRIAIARSLTVEPSVLLLDEPVSALDVSVQAQILNLLRSLQEQAGLAYLFVSHDLAVVRQIADEVAVMYCGKIVEIGANDELFAAPRHPYTQALLAAVPISHPRLRRQHRRLQLAGEVPHPSDPPSGCRFRTRCPRARPECAASEPALTGSGHRVACHFPD